MLMRSAVIFGIAFIAAGILGFVPGITTEDGYLLGLFHVDAVHNFVHILSGAVALVVGYKSEHASRLYFQIFGSLYVAIAVLGMFYGNQPILGFLTNNPGDVVLHLVIAAVALYLGFGYHRRARHVHA